MMVRKDTSTIILTDGSAAIGVGFFLKSFSFPGLVGSLYWDTFWEHCWRFSPFLACSKHFYSQQSKCNLPWFYEPWSTINTLALLLRYWIHVPLDYLKKTSSSPALLTNRYLEIHCVGILRFSPIFLGFPGVWTMLWLLFNTHATELFEEDIFVTSFANKQIFGYSLWWYTNIF